MNDETQATPDQTTAPAPAPERPAPLGAFAAFHEKAVLVQLKVEMTGVTYPNAPVLDNDGNVVGTKLLRGQCLVHAQDQIIELRSADPLYPQLMAITLIPRDLIAFMTRIEPMPTPSGYSR